jgi:hypothetical protein
MNADAVNVACPDGFPPEEKLLNANAVNPTNKPSVFDFANQN